MNEMTLPPAAPCELCAAPTELRALERGGRRRLVCELCALTIEMFENTGDIAGEMSDRELESGPGTSRGVLVALDALARRVLSSYLKKPQKPRVAEAAERRIRREYAVDAEEWAHFGPPLFDVTAGGSVAGREAFTVAHDEPARESSPRLRIEPRPRENGWPCVVCSRAVFFADGMVPCVCDDDEENGGLCAHCLSHFHEGDPALGRLLRGAAARLREHAMLLDSLDEHRPKVASVEEWKKEVALARAEKVIREVGGNPNALDEKILDLVARVLDRDKGDLPF